MNLQTVNETSAAFLAACGGDNVIAIRTLIESTDAMDVQTALHYRESGQTDDGRCFEEWTNGAMSFRLETLSPFKHAGNGDYSASLARAVMNDWICASQTERIVRYADGTISAKASAKDTHGESGTTYASAMRNAHSRSYKTSIAIIAARESLRGVNVARPTRETVTAAEQRAAQAESAAQAAAERADSLQAQLDAMALQMAELLAAAKAPQANNNKRRAG